MSLAAPKSLPRPLYIIAPSLFQCHRTAVAWGLDPRTMIGTRAISSANQLRGTAAGTPFITHGRQAWEDTPEGHELDCVVKTLQRIGRLRVAQPDDLAACNPLDGLSVRESPPEAARAGL